MKLYIVGILLSLCTVADVTAQISSPQDIEGISAWWCADSVLQESETPVTFWSNLVNVSESVTQSVEEYSPTLVKNITDLNNHAVLRFDGNDYLDGGNIMNVGSSGQTAFVVALSTVKDGCYFVKSLAGLGKNRYYCIYENSKPTYLVQYVNSYYGPIGVSKLSQYELLSTEIDLSGAYISFFQNNCGLTVEETQVATSFSSSYNFLIGAYNNNLGTLPPISSLYLNGDIAEMIFYNRPLSNIERQAVENYLRSKYFPGTEREQFSLGGTIKQSYSLKPITLTVPERSYFQTYTWSTGETTSSISVSKSGLYSVYVTDDWGYEYVDTVQIVMPTISHIPSQTICDGSSVVWDCGLSGDYSYEWSTGETTQAITISETGKYAVKITDNQGYSIVSDTVTIAVDDFSTQARLGADTTVCKGNTIGLVARQSEAMEYLWNTGETTPQLEIQNSGTYSVSVTNSHGCVATDEVVVEVQGVAPVVAIVSQYHCLGDTTELLSNSYTLDNTDMVSYTWYVENDTLTGQVQNHRFSTYGKQAVRLVVENEEGCIAERTDTIIMYATPIAQFSPKISCQYTENTIASVSTVADGTIAAYEWQGIGKTSSDSVFAFLSDTVGKYPLSLHVTSSHGCTALVQDTVTVVESPKLVVTHTKSCIGDTVLFFDATTYPVYNPLVTGYWEYDGTKKSYNEMVFVRITDTVPHSIGLYAKTFNGCWNILLDTIQAHDLPHPVVEDTLFMCVGEPVQLENHGTSVDSVVRSVWTLGGEGYVRTNDNVTYSVPGMYSYSLFVTTDATCSNTDAGVIVVEDVPEADFTFFPEYGAAPFEVQFTNKSESAASYLWTFDKSVVDEEEHPIYVFTEDSISYAKLVALSAHGCADSVEKHIPVQISNMKLQITDVNVRVDNGKVQYEIQVLNTGNDIIPEIEFSISSPDFPELTELWKGALAMNSVLSYVFTTKTTAKHGEKPAYVCAKASIASSSQGQTYYTDTYCVDETQEFIVYAVVPNPITSTAKILFATKQNEPVVVDCIDEYGKIRHSKEFSGLAAGYHSYSIDMSDVPAGTYSMRIVQGNKQQTVRVIKE